MSVQKKEPVYSVLEEDENELFTGSPNKIAYIANSFKEELPRFLFEMILKCVLLPFLFAVALPQLSTYTAVMLVVVWIIYLVPTILILKGPISKIKECKNTFYIITDKAIYIQFGVDQIYYRKYPNERIGTKVFYRPSRIDSIFNVGTLGFSVDDYYEERLVSIDRYEQLYNVLKEITNSRKEELQKIREERENKKREYEELSKLKIQEELFLQKQEEEEEKKRRERYEREMEEHFERERIEHERYLKEREERKRMEEERRRENDDDDDDDDSNDEQFNSFRAKRKNIIMEAEPEKEEKPKESDTYDMYGAEIEERSPNEKTVENYRNRFTMPSLNAHRRQAGRRSERRSIKMDPNAPAKENDENKNIDLNKLWASSSNDQ